MATPHFVRPEEQDAVSLFYYGRPARTADRDSARCCNWENAATTLAMSERRSSGHHPVAQDRLPRVVCHFTLHGRKRAVRIGLALGCSKDERMPFQRPLQFRNQGDSANPGLQSTCRENVVICRETNLHWLLIWGEAMDQKTETKFELVGKDAHATAEFRNDLFVVLAGSVARGTSVPSAPQNLSVRRGKLISEGVLEETPEG